jgi:hypothetical protein
MGILAAGWVIIPLVVRRAALLSDGSSGGMADADARRRVALASLKDVEYDRVSGKLDEHDYLRVKAQLQREALAAISAAEQASGEAQAPAGPGATGVAGAHSCGFVNPPGSRFCSGCGRRLA